MISCALFSSLLTQSELPGTGPVSRQAVGRTLLTRPAQMDGFRHLFLSLSAYLWLGLDWKFNSLNILYFVTLLFSLKMFGLYRERDSLLQRPLSLV